MVRELASDTGRLCFCGRARKAHAQPSLQKLLFTRKSLESSHFCFEGISKNHCFCRVDLLCSPYEIHIGFARERTVFWRRALRKRQKGIENRLVDGSTAVEF